MDTDTDTDTDTQTSRDVHARIDGLIDTTWAFSALAAASEIGLLAALDPSCTAAEAAARSGIPAGLATALLDVLLALGLAHRDAARYHATPELQDFLAASSPDDLLPWLRSQHLQSRQMVDAARHGDLRPGWIHTDPELLQAQGRSGRAATRELAKVFPLLPGLQERLQAPGATFLDVGVGVGIVSIELCRIYPALRVVGLEPSEAPAAEARRNIAAAGFEDRIAVRSQRVEELTDQAVFDLAYFPQVFMPLDVVRVGLQRVHDALHPGGWITVVAIDAPGDDLHAVTTRLVNILWGGSLLSADEVADMTRAAGFEWVQIGGVPSSVLKGIGGRRPLSA
jgi:2-polyprenyl-3-methyl-5-hydroxy-6-metoxy-1,4-benzoquinol methylase